MNEFSEIKESSSFVTISADSAVVIGVVENEEETIHIFFTKNIPIICADRKGDVRAKGMEKQKVASLGLNLAQANGLYKTLKLALEQAPSHSSKSEVEGKS